MFSALALLYTSPPPLDTNNCTVLTSLCEGFIANAPNRTKLRLGIQRNFALVTAMIQAHPCLKRDFQIYVRNNGAVLNIDLDRCKRDKSGSVSLSDTEKSRLENETITLTTEPLRLTCPDSYDIHVRIFK